MSSTGPAVLAGPPSVIAQASLESEAFRIAASTPPRWQAVQTPREPQRVTGRPRQLHLHFNGVGADFNLVQQYPQPELLGDAG